MDYKRIALYVIWGFLALLLWHAWQTDYPAPVVQPQTTASAQMQPHAQGAPATKSAAPHSTSSATLAAPVPAARKIWVHTNVLDVAIDTQGAKLVYVALPKYTAAKDQQGRGLVLLNTKQKTYYVANAGITGFKNLTYQTAQTKYWLKTGQKILNVRLTAQKNGQTITKTFTFRPNDYAIGIHLRLENNASHVFSGRTFMQTSRREMNASSHHYLGVRSFTGIAISTPKHPYEKHAFSALAKTPLNSQISGGWLAYVQHYFLSAWVPNPHQSFFYQSAVSNNDLYTVYLMGQTMTAQPGAAVENTMTFYAGPEIKNRLDALAPHLSLTIDYGWLWMISVGLFWLLKSIFTFIGNWGVSIIILTIFIKAAFYKLSETSYRSMAKMRDLQPQIKALKEQYADDKQALGKATMAFYKKEHVNPMGGCLPMIVQIPVFIALYYVLAESVQLRSASFLWIHDLSLKDPFYILPVLMGISMFIQQKLSPPPPDPMQAKMMMLLPVFFTFIFLNFPAGLTLYWLTNNTLSVLQQWHIMRRHKAGKYAKKDKKKRQKKKK
jgi:YidC/Oxa1 family membrane protein insertase